MGHLEVQVATVQVYPRLCWTVRRVEPVMCALHVVAEEKRQPDCERVGLVGRRLELQRRGGHSTGERLQRPDAPRVMPSCGAAGAGRQVTVSRPHSS